MKHGQRSGDSTKADGVVLFERRPRLGPELGRRANESESCCGPRTRSLVRPTPWITFPSSLEPGHNQHQSLLMNTVWKIFTTPGAQSRCVFTLCLWLIDSSSCTDQNTLLHPDERQLSRGIKSTDIRTQLQSMVDSLVWESSRTDDGCVIA